MSIFDMGLMYTLFTVLKTENTYVNFKYICYITHLELERIIVLALEQKLYEILCT